MLCERMGGKGEMILSSYMPREIGVIQGKADATGKARSRRSETTLRPEGGRGRREAGGAEECMGSHQSGSRTTDRLGTVLILFGLA